MFYECKNNLYLSSLMLIIQFFSIILHPELKQNLQTTMKKIVFTAIIALISTVDIIAQSGTNSPYSQYGLGVLSDQGSGFNRGMNGVGVALQRNNQINHLNPASYSKLDSLTFIFDAGLSLQLTNFKEGAVKKNAKNADFEYAVGGFRAAKNLGVGFGIIPYTNIGYNYATSGTLKREEGETETTYTTTFSGSGGIHQAFIGLGWEPVRNFSIGFNVGYLWGDYTRIIANSYSDSYVNTLYKTYEAVVSNYRASVGVQYKFNATKKDEIIIGATYDYGHKLNADPKLHLISVNTQLSQPDTTTNVVSNGLEIPTTIGAGISWNHNNKWNVAFDYTHENWSKVHTPVFSETKDDKSYAATGMYNDRQKFNLGAEYCQNKTGRSFVSRIRYRMGASYTTPYLKINGVDGPKEMSVSAGVGFPIVNGYNNRSFLNISAQWVRVDAKNMIKENTFRINVGLTFNERWFAKWKFD